MRPRASWEKSSITLASSTPSASMKPPFYGPKLDIQYKNVFGKEDTLVTIQIDQLLAEQFDMSYIDQNGQKVRPYIIHRTSLGCYERTLAYLIEKYAGALPTWLSPTQVALLPIADRHLDYVNEIKKALEQRGVRVMVDDRNEKINKKIRDSQMEKIPYMLVIGDRDVENGTGFGPLPQGRRPGRHGPRRFLREPHRGDHHPRPLIRTPYKRQAPTGPAPSHRALLHPLRRPLQGAESAAGRPPSGRPQRASPAGFRLRRNGLPARPFLLNLRLAAACCRPGPSPSFPPTVTFRLQKQQEIPRPWWYTGSIGSPSLAPPKSPGLDKTVNLCYNTKLC